MKVTLRTKDLGEGSSSLYLDIYDKGKRKYKYLRLYLVPEVDDNARRMNENAMKKAQEIRANFVLENATLPKEEKKQNGMKLLEWIEEYKRMILHNGGFSNSTLVHTELVQKMIVEFLKKRKIVNIKLADFDTHEMRHLLEYMNVYEGARNRKLATNTKATYQQRITHMFNEAKRVGLISENPIASIPFAERFGKPMLERPYLTIDEIRRVAAIRHSNNEVRLAFLFACFTGLRVSDLRLLKWDNIKDGENGKMIVIEQKKTRKQVAVPLCKTAMMFLPPEQADGKVFHLPNKTWLRGALQRIMKAAGIDKPITFHSSRHTFATMVLTTGSDISVVSQLLGHRSVTTTQSYADVVMDSKVKAVGKMTGMFDE